MTSRSRIRRAIATLFATVLATSVFTGAVAVSAIALEPPKGSQAWIDRQATGSIAKPATRSYFDMIVGNTGSAPERKGETDTFPSAPVTPKFGI